MIQTAQRFLKPQYPDATGKAIRKKIKQIFSMDPGPVMTSVFYSVDYPVEEQIWNDFALQCLHNPVSEDLTVNNLHDTNAFRSLIAVAFLPGVTDDEGISAQTALADFLNREMDVNTQHIFSQRLYYFEKELSGEVLMEIGKRILGNPLIHKIRVFKKENGRFPFRNYVPKVHLQVDERVETFPVTAMSDYELLNFSRDYMLALNLEEMKAIQQYYTDPVVKEERIKKGLPADPTDIEMEVLAQTWSEHCKHKEFNAEILYEDPETGEKTLIRSLFKTFIKAATDKVKENLQKKNNDWLVKVFNDNAGLVKASDDLLFAWKVETHNSPSALDPYGGAITGILGVNRDVMGTGVGGAELLFNTDVLCFGPPDYEKPLLKGQLHPRQIMEGVVEGIRDGGNKSGVPTVNGSIHFDERFSGKPLVFCGTGGLMPVKYGDKNTWEKPVDPGDYIIMAGGRVGKDGIHGATFSSLEINEHSPMSAVQIGSPLTQKKLMDFLLRATRMGLVKSSTDNGAGGLSSSVGELAEIPGGAEVWLEKVPLKYAGLKPWEIFVSESQERMTLVVDPDKWHALEKLARDMEVEVSHIGQFTASGVLDMRFKGKTIGLLDMHFLHHGVPVKKMHAVKAKVDAREPQIHVENYTEVLEKLLSHVNIRSRESIIRQYDHEVKGKTTGKSLMGPSAEAPQDAAVIRLHHDTNEGIAVSNGIMPKFGDLDAYQMSCGAFDEAVRQIIAVGGKLPNTRENDGIFWSVNDNFAVPDSDYDPVNNPDGKEKLAKLVDMCRALYDMSVFYDIPMTSGKDSMKNDFKSEGKKISVPPTVLYSMAAKIPDITETLSSDFKKPGHLIYQVGKTYDELGGSEFYRLYGELGRNVPVVRKEEARDTYLKMMQAHDEKLLASAHDISDGGLAVALAESLFGTGFGLDVDLQNLGDLSLQALLFAESHARFVVSIAEENQKRFEEIFGEKAFYLGKVMPEDKFVIRKKGLIVMETRVSRLENLWKTPLL